MSDKLTDVERIAFTELAEAVKTRAQWWRHKSNAAASAEVRTQAVEVAEELELVASVYENAARDEG